MSAAKVLHRLLSGTADASIRFRELCSLLEGLGFEKHIRGSHHLFRKVGVEEKSICNAMGTTPNPTRSGQCGPSS